MNFLRQEETIAVIRALFVSQLIWIPVFVIPSLGASLWNIFISTEFYGPKKLSTSGFYFVFYTAAFSSFVTLMYGVPVYLFLKKYQKASLINLVLAGLIPYFVVGPFGALVATAFWASITEHSPRTSKILKGIVLLLIILTMGGFVSTKIIDAYFIDDINELRSERALSKRAPLPKWWDDINKAEKFKNLDEAKAVYQYSDQLKSSNALRLELNRTFFKSAYITIQDSGQDPDFIAELVLLMDMPLINYPYIDQLQRYAHASAIIDVNVRARLLLAMLKNKSVDTPAISWSYDFLTENRIGIKPDIVAPLCSELASKYTERTINYFEISVFRQCKERLKHVTDQALIQPHSYIINEKLLLMEKNLYKSNINR